MKAITAICVLILAIASASFGAPKPAPKINSVTFSAPVPLKAGDIITADLTGTPGTKAAFAVRGFIPVVPMKELSAGSYHGTAKVPKGKFIRNAPLVGYLGEGDLHAAPVQASRLVTVVDPSEVMPKPTVAPLGFAKPGPIAEPDKLPAVKPVPTPAPKPVEVAKPAPVAPPPAPKPEVAKPIPATANIALTSPTDGAVIKRSIVIKGTAEPGERLRITITYSNNLTGVLKLAGNVGSQDVSVGKHGEFRMGPIALDGPLATVGLRFTIKAYYPDRADHATAEISVTGGRN